MSPRGVCGQHGNQVCLLLGVERGLGCGRFDWSLGGPLNPMRPCRRIDEKVLMAVREQPCVACGRRPPNDPSHIKSRGAGGGDTEENTISLCRAHHTMQHTIGWIKMCARFPEVHEALRSRGWEIEETQGNKKLRSNKN